MACVVSLDSSRLQSNDPAQFFRATRQLLMAATAVSRFVPASKGRLKVQLRPALAGNVAVSQERAAAFKTWLAS